MNPLSRLLLALALALFASSADAQLLTPVFSPGLGVTCCSVVDAQTTNQVTGTSRTVAVNVTGANLIVGACGNSSTGSGTTPTISDSAGNTWNTLQTPLVGQNRLLLSYAKNSSTGTDTITCSAGSSYAGPASAISLKNANSSTPSDTGGSGTGTTVTTVSTSTWTAAFAIEAVISATFGPSDRHTTLACNYNDGSVNHAATISTQTTTGNELAICFYQATTVNTGASANSNWTTSTNMVIAAGTFH